MSLGAISELPEPLAAIRQIVKHFPQGSRRGLVHALDDVTFNVWTGETLAIVGESGCGKSTLARILLQLVRQDDGIFAFRGKNVGEPGGLTIRALRQHIQLVFQDSYSSLNPRMQIQDTIGFGLMMQGKSRIDAREVAASLLERVGLKPQMFASRYPHELSGGQRQRVNIARALAVSPKLIVLDEAVSALDNSVQAQVLNVLADLKAQLRLTYVFISHDLDVVRYISDRLLVMYLGKVVEVGPTEQVFGTPKHPYTVALLESRPSLHLKSKRDRAPIAGEPPNPQNPPSGCRFHTRCPLKEPVCEKLEPHLEAGEQCGHTGACHINNPLSGHSMVGQAIPRPLPKPRKEQR